MLSRRALLGSAAALTPLQAFARFPPRGAAPGIAPPPVSANGIVIGDSILAGTFNAAGTDPVSVANGIVTGAGYSISMLNRAIAGSKMQDWAVGDPSGFLAAALIAGAAMSPPATFAVINCGINDAKPFNYDTGAHFSSMLQSCISGLFGVGYTKIILMDYWYIAPGSYPGVINWDGTAASRIQDYMAVMAGLANGTTIFYQPGVFQWSSQNFTTPFLVPATGHPNAAGDAIIGQLLAGDVETVIGGLAPALSVVAYNSTGQTTTQDGAAIAVTLGWRGAGLSNLSASWSGGGGASAITGFAINGPFVSFFAASPASTGTRTLTFVNQAGSLTASTGGIVIAAGVHDFSPGIYGPSTAYYGQNCNANIVIGTWFARGLAGPAICTLTGTDAAKFSVDGPGDLHAGEFLYATHGFAVRAGFAAFSQTQATFSFTINITDGVTALSMAVTVQNPIASIPTATVNGNLVTAQVPNGFAGRKTVCNVGLWAGATDIVLTDPSGLFQWQGTGVQNIISVAAANVIPANFGAYPVTITPVTGPAITTTFYIGSEAPPAVAWIPNGAIYDATPATNLWGSNQIGTVRSYSDTNSRAYGYLSNPSGKLNTWASGGRDPWVASPVQGATFLLSSASVGTISGLIEVNNGIGGTLSSSLVLALPVIAGTMGTLSGTPATGLTNYQPSANALTGNPLAPSATVLTFTAPFTPDPALTVIDVQDDNCQIVYTNSNPNPRYTVTFSGATGTMKAWNLSAQTDVVTITVSDGLGRFARSTFSIIAAWHTYSGSAISIGPGGTYTTYDLFAAALWDAPATFAGAVVRVINGIAAVGDWTYTPGGVSRRGWRPCPIEFVFDIPGGTQTLLDFAYTAPGGSGQGGIMHAGGSDTIIRNAEFAHVSNGDNAGCLYIVDGQSGNLTVDKCYFRNSNNGILNGSNGQRLTVTNSIFARCGDQTGHSHNCYAGFLAKLTYTNNKSYDSWNGHTLKCRAMNATITDNIFTGGMNDYASTPLDFPNGGKVVFSNNIIEKMADTTKTANGGIIDWCSEILSVPAWPVNSLTADGNTIVNTVVPGIPGGQPAVGFRQFWFANDPERLIPIASLISNTQFYNLDSSVWVAGVVGAPAPTLGTGNAVTTIFPVSDLLLINPLTGATPLNLPDPFMTMNPSTGAGGVPSLASASGTYTTNLACPSGSASGTLLGEIEAYDYTGTVIPTPAWTLLNATVPAGGTAVCTITTTANKARIFTSGTLADGIYWFRLQAVGSPGVGFAITKWFAFEVGTGLPSDGFVAGIYLMATAKVNPAIITSDPLISGFTRGTGTWTYSVANSGGGSPYLAVTIDTVTAATSRFTVKATAALLSQVAGTYTATVTANNGVTSYNQAVVITKLPTSGNMGMPGGNVFVASSSPAVATASATIKTYANPVWTKTTGDPMLADNTFPTYMRFFGQGVSDTSGQAYIDSVPSATNPFFVVGFFRPENDAAIYGGLTYFGNNENRANSLIMLTTNPGPSPGTGMYMFAWIGVFTFVNTNFGGSNWNIGGGVNGALNSWEAFCAIYNPNINDNLNFWTDGIFATNQNEGSGWPAAGGGPLSMGFGSYGFRTPGFGDNHSYCGGYRNISVVNGIPNNTDLEAYRNAGGGYVAANSIWPSNVWASWDFDTDLRTTLTIPDASGNGRSLTVANNSGAVGAPLPWRATLGVPYVTDSYGPSGKNLFELVSDGAGGYVIKTVAGVTPSDYYGTYTNVRLVANGYESKLTVFITDDS